MSDEEDKLDNVSQFPKTPVRAIPPQPDLEVLQKELRDARLQLIAGVMTRTLDELLDILRNESIDFSVRNDCYKEYHFFVDTYYALLAKFFKLEVPLHLLADKMYTVDENGVARLNILRVDNVPGETL